jgi:hypothetical protein
LTESGIKVIALKAEISNLSNALAEGHKSAALLDQLGKRARELDEISEELLARLQDIRGLLFADVPRAKAELSKHCTTITLTPEGPTFRIAGDWNLLGGRSDGAGGPARTL